MSERNMWMRAVRVGWTSVLVWVASAAMAQSPLPPAMAMPIEMAERVGSEWEGHLRKGEVTAITGRFDIETMTKKALAGLPGDAASKQEFATQYAAGASASLQFVLKGFSGARFLGVVRTNAVGGVVFRMILPDGSVNYHRYVLEPRAGGSVAVTDLYVMTNGEWASSTVRWLYLLSEGKRGPALASQLTGIAAELVRNAATVERMVGLMQQKKFAEYVESYRSLPEPLRQDRSILHGQLVASQAAEPLQFGLASEAWGRLFPGDPGLDMITFERLAVRGEHAKSAAALGRIEAFVGGDVHLRALRGAQLARAGDVETGRQLALEAVRIEPTLATGHDVLLGIALQAKDHAAVARLLTDVADNLPVDPREVVRNQAQYAAFRESPEGRKWMTNKPEVRVLRRPVPTNAPPGTSGF
jgi:hypothetical protein